MRAPAAPSPIPVVRVYSSLDVGGIERQLLKVLPRIEARGRYTTTLVLTRREGSMLSAFREAGLKVEVVPLRGRFGRRAVLPLAERFRRHRAALVHAHVYEANATATIAALLAGRPPVVASYHVLSSIRSRRRRLQDRLLNRLRAAVVCVSEDVRRNYLAEVGAPPGKVLVLYNGIDVEAVRSVPPDRAGLRAEFGFPGDALVVVCAARLAKQKDHAVLLEAFARAAPRHPRARLLLAGEGPERAAIEARCAEADLAGKVALAGLRPDVPRLLRSADLFAMSSAREGFSNVVLECLAAGLPLAVTDAGGNREAMDGETTGLLVPPGDAGALAAALDRLLGDEDLRARLGRAAGRRAPRFDLERTVDETEALYDRVLAARRRK